MMLMTVWDDRLFQDTDESKHPQNYCFRGWIPRQNQSHVDNLMLHSVAPFPVQIKKNQSPQTCPPSDHIPSPPLQYSPDPALAPLPVTGHCLLLCSPFPLFNTVLAVWSGTLHCHSVKVIPENMFFLEWFWNTAPQLPNELTPSRALTSISRRAVCFVLGERDCDAKKHRLVPIQS